MMITLIILGWLLCGGLGSFIGLKGMKRRLTEGFPTLPAYQLDKSDIVFGIGMALFGPANLIGTSIINLFR